MRFGQWIEYKMRNIFFGKSCTKCDREASPRPFIENQNWAYLWVNSLKCYKVYQNKFKNIYYISNIYYKYLY